MNTNSDSKEQKVERARAKFENAVEAYEKARVERQRVPKAFRKANMALLAAKIDYQYALTGEYGCIEYGRADSTLPPLAAGAPLAAKQSKAQL